MVKRKVNHALISYKTEIDGRTVYENAFRGMIVDIPAAEAERLEAHGALVPADYDLARPGVISALTESPSDEEVVNWVASATDTEIAELVAARPIIATRIEGAKEIIEQRAKEQAELLGQKADIAADAAKDAETPPTPETNAPTSLTGATGDATGDVTPIEPPPPGVDPAASVEDIETARFDELVKGNTSEVSEYLSQNPGHARQVLEAEVRLATAEGRDPRKGVERAAQAAAGHVG